MLYADSSDDFIARVKSIEQRADQCLEHLANLLCLLDRSERDHPLNRGELQALRPRLVGIPSGYAQSFTARSHTDPMAREERNDLGSFGLGSSLGVVCWGASISRSSCGGELRRLSVLVSNVVSESTERRVGE